MRFWLAFLAWIRVAWPLTFRIIRVGFERCADGSLSRDDAYAVVDAVFHDRAEIVLWRRKRAS